MVELSVGQKRFFSTTWERAVVELSKNKGKREPTFMVGGGREASAKEKYLQ
jgi:hypothetical protein